MEFELTDKQIDAAFEGAFDQPLYLDHKPTVEEIFTIKLRAVAHEAQKELVKYVGKNLKGYGDRTIDQLLHSTFWQDILKHFELERKEKHTSAWHEAMEARRKRRK